jgi:hypothetical protein
MNEDIHVFRLILPFLTVSSIYVYTFARFTRLRLEYKELGSVEIFRLSLKVTYISFSIVIFLTVYENSVITYMYRKLQV